MFIKNYLPTFWQEASCRRPARTNDWASLTSVLDDLFAPQAPAAYRPRLDAAQNEDELRLTVQLPGFAPEQVEVEVKEDVLTISATVPAGKEEKESATGTSHYREITRGEFVRKISLPENSQADKISAEFKHGELLVTVPLAKPVEPPTHKIAVKS